MVAEGEAPGEQPMRAKHTLSELAREQRQFRGLWSQQWWPAEHESMAEAGTGRDEEWFRRVVRRGRPRQADVDLPISTTAAVAGCSKACVVASSQSTERSRH